jgi:signal transduction protein with GAF and PtsI domain
MGFSLKGILVISQDFSKNCPGKEDVMKKQLMNYETLLKITKAMSMSRDPEEVISLTVKSIKKTLEVKGCALFLVNLETNELEIVASDGLSKEYVNKGPLSALESIAESLVDGPVAIYDVSDDPRIQYPEAAEKEGIASMLSVPIYVRGDIVGAMRVYSSKPWEFTLEDVNFVQALAQIGGTIIDMCRLYQGQNQMIDILTSMREMMPT